MARSILFALLLACCGSPSPIPAPVTTAPGAMPAPRTEAWASRLLGLTTDAIRARQVSIGALQTCVVTPTGTVSCWSAGSEPSTRTEMALPEPVVEVAMADAHGCARTESGDVYCWGGRHLSELGTGDDRPSETPVRANVSGARALRASGSGTCATLASGDLVCWGLFPNPETGMRETRATPTPMPMRPTGPLVVLEESALAVDADGELWAWGYDGLLFGSGFVPARRFAELGAITDLTSFGATRCASTAAGVFCWGTGVALIVGFPPPPPMPPRRVEGAPPNALLASGQNFVCALDGSSQVSCAGTGDLVDAHDGIWTLGPVVRRIGALDGTIQMSAHGRLLCGVRGDESVHCVGARDPEGPPPPS